MGAESFRNSIRLDGNTAQDIQKAFRVVVEEAEYEHGHGGYSGTIAKKGSFQLLQTFPVNTPVEVVEAYIESTEDENDKWGPAYAVVHGNTVFFYGWASS
tara:strand:- start:1693 stop:1992 length:300 start_codon:yes stop_codon:yes gene_type:complete